VAELLSFSDGDFQREGKVEMGTILGVFSRRTRRRRKRIVGGKENAMGKGRNPIKRVHKVPSPGRKQQGLKSRERL